VVGAVLFPLVAAIAAIGALAANLTIVIARKINVLWLSVDNPGLKPWDFILKPQTSSQQDGLDAIRMSD